MPAQVVARTIVSQMPELPQEVLQLIVNYLPGYALKNIRLSSKALQILAEPRLFSSA